MTYKKNKPLRSRVKITVLKRLSPSEIGFKKKPVTIVGGWVDECGKLKDGQEFIVREDGNQPEGFCSPAWVAIYRMVSLLAYGGNLPYYKEKGVVISCCTDGLRPVIFKLERV